jgi:hypothetical protein
MKNFQVPEVMFDHFGMGFKMFLIVELTKLGGQNFKLERYSENL